MKLFEILKEGLRGWFGFTEGKRKVKVFLFYGLCMLLAFYWAIAGTSETVPGVDGFIAFAKYTTYGICFLFGANAAEWGAKNLLTKLGGNNLQEGAPK